MIVHICMLCSCWMLAGVTAAHADQAVTKEYEIKAAFLYNFAKFVEWPSECFTNDQSPLVIGVFGQNPFGSELQTIARDHQINGRPIVIKPVATLADTGGVHLLFFGAEEDEHVAETLAMLKGAGILTVGESKKFMAAGGMINFIRDGDKVRFEVNNAAAAQHRLIISAQLLKLAASVQKEPRP